MNDLTVNNSERISGSGSASYMKKSRSGKTVFEAGGNLSLSQGITENEIQTETEIFNPYSKTPVLQFQDDRPDDLRYSASTSLSRYLGKGSYLIPSISAGNDFEELDRTQGIPGNPDVVTDSLSPDFQKKYSWLRPKLTYKYTAGRTSLTVGLQLESGRMENTLNGAEQNSNIYNYLLPNVWYEYQFQTGRHAFVQFERKYAVGYAVAAGYQQHQPAVAVYRQPQPETRGFAPDEPALHFIRPVFVYLPHGSFQRNLHKRQNQLETNSKSGTVKNQHARKF
jgi:hypothetical protein